MNERNVGRPQGGPGAETLGEMSGGKIYFLSDFHLGVPDHASSLVREKRIVSFLNEAEKDATEIHILCDRVAVLDYGRKIAEGDTEAVRKDPAVIAAYLGGEAA